MTTLPKINEFEILKAKLKMTWMVGDFGKIARSFTDGAAEFVNRLNLSPGMRILDIACGTGNQSIPAARTGATVTGLDIAPNLLAQARKNADKENLKIQFDEGDAENLPYPDSSFDVVFSMFGAMFAPRQDKVSAELVRVCRPGGIIAMANWTLRGFVGQIFGTIGSYLPPANAPSPLLWGEESQVRKCFGEAVSDLRCTRRLITLTFPFAIPETIEYWRDFYGPVHQAFATLDENGQADLRKDLELLWAQNNLSSNGITRIKAEYLEAVAIRSR